MPPGAPIDLGLHISYIAAPFKRRFMSDTSKTRTRRENKKKSMGKDRKEGP